MKLFILSNTLLYTNEGQNNNQSGQTIGFYKIYTKCNNFGWNMQQTGDITGKLIVMQWKE